MRATKAFIVLLLSVPAYDNRLNAQDMTTAAASVFRVVVSTKERPTAPSEGTAFVVHVEGDLDNPVLYLLTAAHVILGPEAGDDTRISDVVETVSVKFGSAVGDIWPVDVRSIRIPPQWESTGRDVALVKIISAGRKIAPLTLTSTLPREKTEFEAYGFPSDLPSAIVLGGRTTGSPGANSAEPWILVDAALTAGMSGGPAMSDGRVFGLVQGRPKSVPELKFLVPISVITKFLEENVPGLHLPGGAPFDRLRQASAKRFDVRLSAIVHRVKESVVQERFDERSSPINVGCKEVREVEISYAPPPDLQTIDSYQAQWIDFERIYATSAVSEIRGRSVTARGKIMGPDEPASGCSGPGHGTLQLSGRVSRFRKEVGEQRVSELGASELVTGDKVTFSLPVDKDDIVELLRIDARPVGSKEAYQSIRLNYDPTAPENGIEQILFGVHFWVGTHLRQVSIGCHVL